MNRTEFAKFYNGALTKVCKELGMGEKPPFSQGILYENIQNVPSRSYFEFYAKAKALIKCAGEANSELLTSSAGDAVCQSDVEREAYINQLKLKAKYAAGADDDATDGWNVLLSKHLESDAVTSASQALLDKISPDRVWTPKRCLYYRGALNMLIFSVVNELVQGAYGKSLIELKNLSTTVEPFLIPDDKKN